MCFGSTPTIPAPEPAKPPPQEAKAPDYQAVKKRVEGAVKGPGVGVGSTMLTGPAGIDPGLLNLGKTKLLGE